MWHTWAENAKSSVSQALDRTGDVISRAATNAGKSLRETGKNSDGSDVISPTPVEKPLNTYDQPTIVQLPSQSTSPQPQQEVQDNDKKMTNENQLLSSISLGWFNVLDATVASIKHAEEAIQEQRVLFQEKITKSINVSYQRRDVSLPLDVEALQDAELVYITDRIITMGHPTMDSKLDVTITGRRKVIAIAHLLDCRHAGHYMIWNLSEVDYDLEIFHDQVLTYSFPGSPSPPLGLLLKLFISMESWLKADSLNVAVVHCLTGKGRTSIVLAAFLCWMGEAQFFDIYEALEYIASCKQVTLDDLTIPSQRRYASYFKNMLDGVRPSQPPLMLKRIIMSDAPNFAKGPPRNSNIENDINFSSANSSDAQLYGCLPYVQIFKAGVLLHTAPASLHFQQAENEIPFCYTMDGNISFNINLVIQGDILVRVRHLTPNKKRISMFRAAFHTGYAPPNVMRFSKSQLDGACADDRFKSNFFVDFIFEPVDAEEASKLLLSKSDNGVNEENPKSFNGSSKVDNVQKAVQASAEDSMLYGDSRFWDVISNRMKENACQATNTNNDPMFGLTVGRRRCRKNAKTSDTNVSSNDSDTRPENHGSRNDSALGAFSIGGEIDFLPVSIGSESSQMQTIDPTNPQFKKKSPFLPPPQPKQDSLIEALMGALDDNQDENVQCDEEIVEFDAGPDSQTTSMLSKSSLNDLIAPADVQECNANKIVQEIEANTEKKSAQSNSLKSFASFGQRKTQQTIGDESLSSGTPIADDFDHLLAGVASEIPEGLSDADLLNLDIDDAELDDLETFLSKN